jgi:P-type conjugative transfer protein TrbJ
MTHDDPRRNWLAGAATVALALVVQPASAQIPVYDPSRYLSMVRQLQKAAQVFQQLSSGAQLLQNAARKLPTSFRSVEDILLGVRTLTGDVNAIGYRIETVSRQFHALFPDEAAVHDTDPRDTAELSERWDREIHMSALAAERSQTTLSRIDTNTRSARDLVQSSSNNDSVVAQLQVLVQMIEVINSDLASLSTTLDATERVNSTLAATQASSREVEKERRRRLLQAYDTRPASTGIDDAFLQVP